MIMPASNKDNQPQLPSVPWSEFFLEAVQREGISTGEQFKERHPERYKAVIQLLSAGIGILKIRDLTGAHPKTTMAIRDSNQEAIEMGKQRLARTLRYIGTLAADSLAEDLENGVPMSAQQRAIIMAISIDKAQLLEGAPTSIVSQAEQTGPTHEDFLRRIAAARRVQAEQPTGLASGESAPKGPLPAPGAGPDPAAPRPAALEPDQVIPPGDGGQSDNVSGSQS